MKNEIFDDITDQDRLDFAGFGLRLGAYLIDIIPIVIILNVLLYLFFGLNPLDVDDRIISLGGQEFDTKVIVRDVSFFVWLIYCTIMEASSFEGTFGKKLVGIKVIDEDGNRLSMSKSMVRNSTKILSYVAIGLGFIWAAFNRQKKGWHDIVARTFVIKKNKRHFSEKG